MDAIKQKKYELVLEKSIEMWGVKLFRIRALMTFSTRYGTITKGDEGGYVKGEASLAQDGNAWVSGDAQVSGNARVYGDAQVSGDAWVYGDAQVYGNARVSGDAWVYGDAQVYGNARVYGDAQVSAREDIAWFSVVGSSQGTLTAFRCETGIKVTRGCFIGTLDEFIKAVKENHGKNKVAKEYSYLIQFIKLRFGVKTKRIRKPTKRKR